MSTAAEHLVVPVDVQALCVGEHDTLGDQTDPYGTREFARLAPDFAVLPYLDNGVARNELKGPNLSALALPEPFAKTDQALTTGIHLHWALPKALVHGQYDSTDDGTIILHHAPNRWLVIRILVDTAAPTAAKTNLKGWVVESDRAWVTDEPGQLPQNDASATAPTAPKAEKISNRAYTKVGKVFDLATWQEDPNATRVSRTNALGFGDTAYAAAYPMCPNVFGFHDTLADLPAGYDPKTSTVSYLIAGWYSDLDRDPVAVLAGTAGMTPKQFLAALESDYGWSVDLVGPMPDAMVCSGTIDGIEWDPSARYVTTPPSNSLTASIGNNRLEAVSAMLAAQPSLSGLLNVELLLNVVQAGLLPDLTTSLATVDERLHERRFGTRRAGTLWRVQRDRPVPTDSHTPPNTTKPPTLPPGIASLLNDLNLAQTAVDEAEREIRTRRQQIFADWTKYMKVTWPAHGNLPNDEPSPNDVQLLIKAEVTAHNAQQTRLDATLLPALAAARATVETAIPTGFDLKPVDAPRYWMPTDPLVLVAGDEAAPPDRHGDVVGYDEHGRLRCRTTGTLTSGLSVASDSHKPFTVTASQVPNLTAPPGPAATLDALISDAMLVLPPVAAVVAMAFADLGSDDNPAIEDFEDFVNTLQVADASWLNGTTPGGNITYAGVAPSPMGHHRWDGNPWIPLLLQWCVSLRPECAIDVSTRYPPDLIVRGYRLDDHDVDLTPLAAPPTSTTAQIFNGTVGLAGRTTINIAHQINVFLESHPTDSIDPELNEVLTGMANEQPPMLAQALSGLRDAFRMRHQILQLPVNDPIALLFGGKRSATFSNVTVHDAVGGENSAAALPNGFYNGLNAGYLDLLELRLIDSFGQVRNIDVRPGKVIRSHSLRPETDPSSTSPVLLRPRLGQPSRLRFRWLAADSDVIEMNAAPTSSPICGWVLFNHLDSSLMIYERRGAAVGSFDLRGKFWQGAPGNDATFDVPVEQVFKSANPHLRAFALGIDGNPERTAFLKDLLSTIDTSITLIEPRNAHHHRATSVLFGRPLALVRAELDLELEGRPSIDESWAALNATIENWNGTTYPEERSDAGFPDIRVPVQLGDISNLDDGLVGYFIDDGSEEAYRTFYAAAAPAGAGGVKRPRFEEITVSARAQSDPVTLSMLLDPRASVHATTGLLPVKSIEIPPAMYSDALRNMAVVFLATPAMTSTHETTIPLPDEAGFSWTWVTRTATGGGWSVTPRIASPNPKAAFSYPPQTLVEGWLKLTPHPTQGAVTGTFVAGPPSGGTPPTAPLGFSLTNPDGHAVITIGTDVPANKLTFKFTNLTGQPITVRGNSGGHDATTLTLHFSPQLLTTTQQASLKFAAPGWTAGWGVKPGDISATWSLTPNSDITLADGETVTFTIDGVTASPPAAHGLVTVDYTNAGTVADSFQQLPLARQNAAPDGSQKLQLLIGFDDDDITVTSPDDVPIPNSLVLRIANDSDTTPVVPPGTPWDPGNPPVFYLSFVYGKPPGGYNALTTPELAQNITVTPTEQDADGWSGDPQPSGTSPVWTLTPNGHTVLGVGEIIELQIDGISSQLPPDTTLIYLQHANIPGYQDGTTTAFITKVPQIKITNFTTRPYWAPAKTPTSVTLAWTVTGAKKVELETPLWHDVTQMNTYAYPTPLAETKQFGLHATRGTASLDVYTSFDIVEFTVKHTVPLPPPTGRPSICRSHRWNVLYLMYYNLPIGTKSSPQILIYDVSTGALLSTIDAANAPDSYLGMSQSPKVFDGVDRLVLTAQNTAYVWDIAEDHSATKVAEVPVPRGIWSNYGNIQFGFRSSGEILFAGFVEETVQDENTTWTIYQTDATGASPARELYSDHENWWTTQALLGGPGDTVALYGWKKTTDSSTPLTFLVRKVDLLTGHVIDQVTLGEFPRSNDEWGDWISVELSAGPDGGAFLFAAPDGVNQVVWIPFDGKGTFERHVIPGVQATDPGYGDGQVSPDYIDLVVPIDGGRVWIAPTNAPLGGTMLNFDASYVGAIFPPPTFEPDGSGFTVYARNPESLIMVERSVVGSGEPDGTTASRV